jgi:serine/threonine protein kinase/tetratricopeptide (TPR) repeat protein
MTEPSLPEESLFAQALEFVTVVERAAFLDRACGTNQELRAELDALLRAHQRSGDLLDLTNQAPSTTADVPAGESPGVLLGPYKLLQLIGEGGMGTVWMAEQQEPIRRHVALKVVKAGMDSRQVLARFEAERQALALMEHPNIAKVLDAGRTPSGPYFVMELVQGQPITTYSDENRLAIRQRLELFGDVCRAVQHAHQKGIIHRDLKPSNVLVAPYDGRPVVKVIDFGVAKATGQQLTDKTQFTGVGSLVGTPEYMSPEQAEVNNQDIDTRSDIYALGVLLYELLTGSTPLRQRTKEAGLLEVLRVIREEEPPRPSTRLSESKDTLPSISAQRQTEPEKLTKLLRGELDWIVMKALEKDRTRRYETANGLALDVQRYLADEPVEACPPSATYRLRKFLRRNKGPALAASVILLLLTAAIVGTTIGLVRALAAEQRAITERDEKEVARKLAQRHAEEARDNFQLARQAVDDYSLKVSEDKRLRETSPALRKGLLEAAVPFYERLLARGGNDPAMREELARASIKLASITDAIDNPKKSIPHYEKALTLLDGLVAEFPTRTAYQAQMARANLALGRTHLQIGDNTGAENAFLAAVDVQRNLANQEPTHAERQLDLGAGLQALGNFYCTSGNVSQAESHFKEAVNLFQGLLQQHGDVDEYRRNLERTYRNLGVLYGGASERTKDQEKVYLECLSLCEMLVKRHPHDETYEEDLADILGNLGILYGKTRRFARGEKAYLDALAIKRSLAEKHPELTFYQKSLVNTMDDLGSLYSSSARLEESEKIHREVIPLQQRLADRFPEVLDFAVDLAGGYDNLGLVLRKRDKDYEALESFDKAIRTLESVLRKQAKHSQAREFLSIGYEGRALTLKKLHREGEAVASLDRALQNEDGPYRSTLRAERARCNARAGALAAACAEADELLAQPLNLRPNDFVILGYMHVSLATKLVKDVTMAAPQRVRRVGEHHSKAVSLFNQARKAGYFEDTKDRNEFLTDDELTPLRARADFQELVHSLEAIK